MSIVKQNGTGAHGGAGESVMQYWQWKGNMISCKFPGMLFTFLWLGARFECARRREQRAHEDEEQTHAVRLRTAVPPTILGPPAVLRAAGSPNAFGAISRRRSVRSQMALWVDKHRPHTLETLTYHPDLTLRLEQLVCFLFLNLFLHPRFSQQIPSTCVPESPLA